MIDNGGSTTGVGVIAGGVVGGLVVIAAIIFFFPREERARVVDLGLVTEGRWGTMGAEHAHKAQRLYDPLNLPCSPLPFRSLGELHALTGSHHPRISWGIYRECRNLGIMYWARAGTCSSMDDA